MIGSGNESQLKLRSEVRHEALEHSVGGRRGGLGPYIYRRDQEDKSAERNREQPLPKHASNVAEFPGYWARSFRKV